MTMTNRTTCLQAFHPGKTCNSALGAGRSQVQTLSPRCEEALLTQGGLVLAAILSAARWLRNRDHREDLVRAVRQRLCRHEWRSMDDLNRNSNAIFVSFHTHYCRNCGADG